MKVLGVVFISLIIIITGCVSDGGTLLQTSSTTTSTTTATTLLSTTQPSTTSSTTSTIATSTTTSTSTSTLKNDATKTPGVFSEDYIFNLLILEVKSYVGYVDVTVIDPEGKKVGALWQDKNLVGEINELKERAFYTGTEMNPEIVVIEPPINGLYRVEITGAEMGDHGELAKYDLNLTVILEDKLVLNKTITSARLEKGKSHYLYYEVKG